jgi:nucleotide-binding universal stress UspA family protein
MASVGTKVNLNLIGTRSAACNAMAPTLIWALDAFESSAEMLEAAVRTIKQLDHLQANIKPVYILTPGQLNLPTEFAEFTAYPMTSNYKPAALKALQGLLKGVSLPRLLSPEVISLEVSSSYQAAEALSRYATIHEARAIVASSHGRSGIGRFILGSFAETLLFKSTVPVIVVHPQPVQKSSTQIVKSEIRKILFPTDFGPVAERSFRSVVELAKELDAQVTLFHSVPHPVEPVLQSGVYLLGGGWMPIHTYMGKEVERRQRRADAWARWAKTQMGVQVTPFLNTEGGSVSDLVLGLVEKDSFDMVCMATRSGPISSALIGSVARQVVRHAACPVWILKLPRRSISTMKPAAAA